MWAVSSAGEHYVDIVGVTSSILVPPTIFPTFSAKMKIDPVDRFKGKLCLIHLTPRIGPFPKPKQAYPSASLAASIYRIISGAIHAPTSREEHLND